MLGRIETSQQSDPVKSTASQNNCEHESPYRFLIEVLDSDDGEVLGDCILHTLKDCRSLISGHPVYKYLI